MVINMKKNIRLFSIITLLVMLLVSCGSNTDNDDNIDKLADGDLIVRENVNEINLAVSSFDTFNPIMTKSVSVAEFMKTVCEPLFEYDEACNPIGILAKNYTVSSDGYTVSFDVAPVKFHDSTTLSAKDVIYTVNMIKDNDTIYSDNAKYIKNIFSDDNARVYIKLTKPVVNFAGMLNFPIVKHGTPEEIDPNYIPVGTGPCKYYGKKTANQITFTANEEWHEGETGFKRVVVNVLKDSQTMIHSFDAGEIDVISGQLANGEEMTPRGEYSVNEYISNAFVFLGINNKDKKLSGKWTRKALELLCDRQKIVDVDVYSRAEAVKVPINPSAWFYPEIAEEARDYETVNLILSKDGWIKTENGYYREFEGTRQELTLKILVHKDNEEKARVAQHIADLLNSFGIKATIKPVDFETYKTAVTDKSYELFIGEVIMDKSMDPSFLTDSEDNYFNYGNFEMDNILLEMSKTADTNAIKEGAARYAALFNDEVPFIPLFFRKESVVYNKYLSGVSVPNHYQIYRDIDKWYISKTK